jgi:hypothetical protein
MRHCSPLGRPLSARPLATTYPAVAQRQLQLQLLALPRGPWRPHRCLMNSHAHRSSTLSHSRITSTQFNPAMSTSTSTDRSMQCCTHHPNHPPNRPQHSRPDELRSSTSASTGAPTSSGLNVWERGSGDELRLLVWERGSGDELRSPPEVVPRARQELIRVQNVLAVPRPRATPARRKLSPVMTTHYGRTT